MLSVTLRIVSTCTTPMLESIPIAPHAAACCLCDIGSRLASRAMLLADAAKLSLALPDNLEQHERLPNWPSATCSSVLRGCMCARRSRCCNSKGAVHMLKTTHILTRSSCNRVPAYCTTRTCRSTQRRRVPTSCWISCGSVGDAHKPVWTYFKMMVWGHLPAA